MRGVPSLPDMVRASLLVPLAVALVTAAGCLQTVQRTTQPPDARTSFDTTAAYLKAHVRNGEVVLFSSWSIDSISRVVRGRARRFDLNRTGAPLEADHQVPLDSVVLFESNRVESRTSAALTVVSGVSLGATAACAANPKACFGSCPTIYVGDGAERTLEAESFSSSVSPSLEATDVDALPGLRAVNGVATVHVRNEALETHNIRRTRMAGAGGQWLVCRTRAWGQRGAAAGTPCIGGIG